LAACCAALRSSRGSAGRTTAGRHGITGRRLRFFPFLLPGAAVPAHGFAAMPPSLRRRLARCGKTRAAGVLPTAELACRPTIISTRFSPPQFGRTTPGGRNAVRLHLHAAVAAALLFHPTFPCCVASSFSAYAKGGLLRLLPYRGFCWLPVGYCRTLAPSGIVFVTFFNTCCHTTGNHYGRARAGRIALTAPTSDFCCSSVLRLRALGLFGLRAIQPRLCLAPGCLVGFAGRVNGNVLRRLREHLRPRTCSAGSRSSTPAIVWVRELPTM